MATTTTPKARGTSDPAVPERATAVLILGMHRSGTSALTRALNLLGVALGDNLLPPAAGNNETGFWEHQSVVELHEELLAELGMTWDDPRALASDWLDRPQTAEIRARIATRMRDDFGSTALWGVKDPRMCRFVPLWEQVAHETDATPAWVIMLRHPLEIVRSLQQRDGLSSGRGYLLWLRHALESERHTRGTPRVFVDYASLMSDWRATLQRIADELGLPLALDDSGASDAIGVFLKPQLRHFSFHDELLKEDARLARWVGAAHDAFGRLLTGPDAEAEAALDLLAAELDLAGWYYDDVVGDAAPREKRLADEINALHQRLHERQIWASEQESRVGEREARIAERDTRIAERDAIIANLRSTHDELARSQARAIDDLQQIISGKEAEQHELRSEIARLHQNFRYVASTFSWKVTRPLRLVTRVVSGILGALRLRTLELMPISFVNLRPLGHGHFEAESLHPYMILDTRRGRLPTGWVEVEYRIEAKRVASPFLFIDQGAGIKESDRIRLPPTRNGHGKVIVRLPDRVTAIRFDPVTFIGEFKLEPIRVRELNSVMLGILLVWQRIRPALTNRDSRIRIWNGLRTALKRGGIREVKQGLLRQATTPLPAYHQWCDAYATLTEADVQAIGDHIKKMKAKPVLSVIMPTYNTDPEVLDRAIQSVRNQIYPRWELCIADDASTHGETQEVIRRHAGEDDRIKTVFREVNGHISAASNSALDLATGDFVVLLDHDDELTSHALYMIASELNDHPNADVIYSDEDKLDDNGEAYQPYFKPDWSPDMFLAQNYLNHVSAHRRSLVEVVGRFREGFEGSQDYDLALRVIERTTAERIRHIPHVLYHWRAVAGSVAGADEAKDYALEAARRAITEHLERTGIDGEVVPGADRFSHRVIYALPHTLPLVSLIVPTRNKAEVLKLCIDGIREHNDYPNWELILVDNGSDEDESLEYLEALGKDPRITVLRDDGPFNYSRLNNRAARMAKGEILGLLNNDIEPINRDWLTEMVRQVVQPGVGAVGAKLYYPNDTLQHGGVIVGLGGVAGHFDKRLPRNERGYFGRAGIVQNFTAVTAACMLMPKTVWDEVEGLDEHHLSVAFNDVDLCLKVRKAGYRIVWSPYAELYHHESVSRGQDTEPEKLERFASEVRTMQTRWNTTFDADPYYNPNLTLDYETPHLADPPRVIRPWEEYFAED
ncbi:glycosyl transferase, group 2 family protein [alpha proteobacterium BAL199]|nr:glycosyl transferase, group 2 family protein [alpha proteobacterium BAL199]